LLGQQASNARERIAVELTFAMLALLLGLYVLCAALVLFAEHVIRPRSPEPADAADLSQPDALPTIGAR
jgi:hypothetical protein